MSEGTPLIDLGELSKPATVLIEKISSAIGVLYEPTRIKKEAQAEAQAEITKAMANIKISAIERRALTRLIQEEGKKQENIESITANATSQLNDDATPEELDNDWISHFFEKCKNISDKEMQGLWSKLLAGECNKLGSFSKRTIDLVASIDKQEAHLFTQLCTFSICGKDYFPLIFDHNSSIYQKRGLNFESISHLETIGLIKYDSFSNFALNNLPKQITLSYFGIPINFCLREESNNKLDVGQIILTKIGQQLAPICGAQADMSFLSYLIEHYKKKGVDVRSPNHYAI